MKPVLLTLFLASSSWFLSPGSAPPPGAAPRIEKAVSAPAGAVLPAGGMVACSHGIVDQTSAGCMSADSTPTLGALYPLSADFNLDLAGNVGMGTTIPAAKLHVSQPSTLADGLFVHQSAASGSVNALYAQTDSIGGSATGILSRLTPSFPGGGSAAIRGECQSTGVTGYGVFGIHEGTGTAVLGSALNGKGVYGYSLTGIGALADSDTGVGLQAYSRTNIAVDALHSSSSGTQPAIQGRTNSTSSSASAVLGRINSTLPGGFSAGVRGINSGTGGNGIGVYGSHGGSGWGVYGSTVSGRGVIGFASAGGFGVYSSGDFGGTGAKYFIQPHPADPAREIRYVSLEGNECGTYFRGSRTLANGECVIEVPEDFRLVSDPEGLTVQVTALGDARLWVESKDLETIVVRGNRDVPFDYFVNGVRAGFTQHETLHANESFVPRERGVPFGMQYPEDLRRILVENGILNPDYTPNETTALRMGWELADPVDASANEKVVAGRR